MKKKLALLMAAASLIFGLSMGCSTTKNHHDGRKNNPPATVENSFDSDLTPGDNGENLTQ